MPGNRLGTIGLLRDDAQDVVVDEAIDVDGLNPDTASIA